jgi:hypothetical protein
MRFFEIAEPTQPAVTPNVDQTKADHPADAPNPQVAEPKYTPKANLTKLSLELKAAMPAGRFEATGKQKGKPNPEIINAIGRVFADLPSNIGDHQFAIDKLK